MFHTLLELILMYIVAIVKTRLLVYLVFLLRLLLCSLIVVFSGSFCTSNSIIIMYIFYHTKISCQENHKRFTNKCWNATGIYFFPMTLQRVFCGLLAFYVILYDFPLDFSRPVDKFHRHLEQDLLLGEVLNVLGQVVSSFLGKSHDSPKGIMEYFASQLFLVHLGVQFIGTPFNAFLPPNFSNLSFRGNHDFPFCQVRVLKPLHL